MNLEPGAVICERLEIDCVLDDAGAPVFAPSYAGRDVQSGQDLWIAGITRRLLPGSVDISRFMAGANELARVRHPTLVRVVVVDREPELCVVAYEWLPDVTSVASLLDAGKPIDAARLARESARALGFLHKQGLTHGMLSAHTVLQWEDTFALWQYGLAKLCEPLALVQRCRRLPDQVFAPEYLRGDPLTQVVDVHAWGVLMARVGTGSDAVEAVNNLLHDIGDPDLPAGLLEVTKAALDPSPDQRPRDGVQLRAMVEEALRPRRKPATPPPRSAAPPKPPPRPPKPPPAPQPEDSGVLLETGDYKLVDLDGDDTAAAPKPVRQRSAGASRAGRERAAAEEPDLAALASEHVALEPAGMVGLPAQAADDELDMVIRDVRGKAPAALGMPFPGQQPAPARDAEADGPKPILTLPRRPGPHGPRALVMTGWLLLSMLSIVGLTGWRVAVHAGGFFVLLGAPKIAEPAPRAEETGALPSKEGAGAEGTGEEDEIRIPKLDLPDPADLLPECPRGTVHVDDKICIEVWEYPGLMRVPHVGVSHRDAAMACEDRKGRLCTLKEWQRACYGPKRAKYSYGPIFEQNRCNTTSVAGFPQEVALAGSHKGCVSAIGTYDMVGNVGEWVAEGIAVGGDSTTPGKIASCAAKGRPPPGYAGPDLGFRCCFDLLE